MRQKTFLFILLSLMPLFLYAEPIVDFDGRSKGIKITVALSSGIVSMDREPVVSNTKDVIISPSPEHSSLQSTFKTLSKSGEWITAQPIQTNTLPIKGATAESLIKSEILTEAGKFAELKPTQSFGGKINQYSVLPGTKRMRTFRCPRRQYTLKIEYTYDPAIGGHPHSNISVPSLSISSVSLSPFETSFLTTPSPIVFPNLQMNTTYYYWEEFPTFATEITEHLSGCISTTDYIQVKVPGLKELLGGDNYYYDYNPPPPNVHHYETHYGTQELINAVKSIANTYKAAFPDSDRLYIYDMSLPRGGIIDINHDWKKPFWGHETGIDADISKKMVPLENRKKLLEIMCSNADTYSEQDVPGEPAYFHIRVSSNSEEDDFGQDGKATIKCCKGKGVDPSVLEMCIATNTLKPV